MGVLNEKRCKENFYVLSKKRCQKKDIKKKMSKKRCQIYQKKDVKYIKIKGRI